MIRYVLLILISSLFILLALMRREYDQLNREILKSLHQTDSPALDWLAIRLAQVGDNLPVAIISAICVAYLFLKRRWIDSLMLAGILIFGSILNTLLKSYFADPRPDVFLSPRPETNYSFPSGHAQAAVALYGSLALLARRCDVTIGCGFMIAGICWCRLYLGVHWPTDVLAGVLVGGFAVTLGFTLASALRDRAAGARSSVSG